VGNIANNAYNNAKFLRRKGVEADVLCYDYTHVMAQPEWEDAEFDGQPDEFLPRWQELDLRGFERPPWFYQDELVTAAQRHAQLFRGQIRLQQWVRCPGLWRRAAATYWDCGHLFGRAKLRFLDLVRIEPSRARFEKWYERYDLIQAYATEPIHALMFGGARPYVAFEHGTMREIPFEDSARGRLLSVAYRQAGKVIITNPDVLASAQRLGLKNFLFIPHPVDETKYRPRATPLRQQVRSRHQADSILFAPSRHNWELKGNDRMIRAFARLTTGKSLKPMLILCAWGQEVARSRRLIDELGISRQVVWMPPLSKMKLIDYYNAADVVLDQFTLGVFGTVTPEAMACGRPVVGYFNREVHEWCYAEMPPVVSACTEDEIFDRLEELCQDPVRREAVGQASRAWVEKYHGWELVADRQIAIYRELLQR
jgi:glycosyltransferase involved in cell wall biosynthesis